MTAPEASYAPGNWVAVAGPSSWLLAEFDPGANSVVADCWRLIRRDAHVDDVLDAIVSVGFKAVPSFAFVHVQGSSGRTVVRGTAIVRLTASGSVREVRASSATTWADEVIDGPLAEIDLTTAEDISAGYALPLSSGVSMASAVRIMFRTHPADDSLLDRPAPDQPAPPAAEQPVFAARQEPAEPELPAPSYDRLFGDTQPPAVVELPLPVPAPQDPATDRPARTLTGGWPTVPPHEPEPPAFEPAPVTALAIIDAVPWEQPATESAPVLSGSAPSGSADRLDPSQATMVTIDRSRLLTQATGVSTGGPTVLAARCPMQHLNPANASVCRICRAAIPAQQPSEVPRPVLGVLQLSTGDVVTLDRGVLMGRAPEVAEVSGADRPHRVRLADTSGDISRVHLAVSLEGWHVLVTDLNSVNGTTVTLPGQPPVRLRPADPLLIEPGAVVSLADEVTFRYEVTG